MAEIGRWNGHKFEISPSVIRGFTGLTVKGSCETKDKKKSKQQYVTRENGKPSEISLTVVLNAGLGCDVRTDSMQFISDATSGAKDYFYVGNSKLLTCKLMLVDASIKELQVGDGNTWLHAEIALTMKQCDKGDSTSGSSKKSSKKKSAKKSSKKNAAKDPDPNRWSEEMAEVDAITGAAPIAAKVMVQQTVKKVVSSATNTIKKITTAAKKLTASRKSTPKATSSPSSSRRISGATR